jgi:hypothetical protein
MPTMTSIYLPPVSGFVSGLQPKINNAQPSGTPTSPPQVNPLVYVSNRTFFIMHRLHPNSRIGDTITYYGYPIPSFGALITLSTTTLTLNNLTRYITKVQQHYAEEFQHPFSKTGTHEIYYEQQNASGSFTVISQNFPFTFI